MPYWNIDVLLTLNILYSVLIDTCKFCLSKLMWMFFGAPMKPDCSSSLRYQMWFWVWYFASYLLSVIFCHSISNGFSVQFWYLRSDFLLDSSNIHTSQSTPSTSRLTKQGYQINIYFELKNIEMDFLETFYIDMLKLVVICLHFRNEDICHF